MEGLALFHIERLAFYKVFGGVIDELLARGRSVGILLDVSRSGDDRGIGVPTEKNVPHFRNGRCVVVPYQRVQDIAEMVKAKGASVLIVHDPISGDAGDLQRQIADPGNKQAQYQRLRSGGIPVVNAMNHSYEHCLCALEVLSAFDANCMTSPWSVAVHKKLLEKEGVPAAEVERCFADRVVMTGSPVFDMFERVYLDQEDVRSSRDTAVLFVPAYCDDNPFLQIMLRDRFRLTSAMRSLLRYRGMNFFDIWRSPRFLEFLSALEGYARAVGVRLIAKSRPKHLDPYRREIGLVCEKYIAGTEDEFYPAYTSAEVFRGASCSFGVMTTATVESVLAGVPAVNIEIPLDRLDYPKRSRKMAWIKDTLSPLPEGPFNFSGCVTSIPWQGIVAYLKGSLSNVPRLDEARRKAYVKEFCGVAEYSSSARVADVIESVGQRG